MGLRLFFLPNFPEGTFIQGGTFIPDSRVVGGWVRRSPQKGWSNIGMVPYLYYTRLNLCKKILPTKHEFSYIEHHISLEKIHFQIKQTQNRCAVCITETAQKLAPNK